VRQLLTHDDLPLAKWLRALSGALPTFLYPPAGITPC